MLKVLIVDDEFIVRAGLISCIDWKALDLALIGEAANGQDALNIILHEVPDILLLDLLMPEMTGMELIDKLEELHIKTNIIILSCHEDYSYVRDAFKKGVRDYILKLSSTPEEISSTIRDVANKILDEQTFRTGETSCTPSQEHKHIRSDIADALNFIASHYNESLSLTDVANYIHMSKNHFSYLFRKEVGHTFSDYLVELRIGQAKHLLEENHRYTVTEIAELTGFSDTGYFCRVFKKITGISPNHYKQGGSI